MWRLKRERIPGVPDAVRVSVELADDPVPVAVSPEAMTAATVGPMPLTDTAVIAQLRQQLAAKDGTIGRLNEQLASRAEAAPDCAGCAGLHKSVAEYEAAARTDRRRIAQLEKTLRAVAAAHVHAEAHRELTEDAA